jgi:hypothetical protein
MVMMRDLDEVEVPTNDGPTPLSTVLRWANGVAHPDQKVDDEGCLVRPPRQTRNFGRRYEGWAPSGR